MTFSPRCRRPTRHFPRSSTPPSGSSSTPSRPTRSTAARNFEFRQAELGLSATVDPFARAYAIINGNDDGIDVEEAAIVTTSLPYSLTLKGGRFFADFGRLSKFHDHDLPFVNRPIVLDEYVGGESQANGAELSYLTPLSQYLTLTAGWYNKIGAENERVSNLDPRPLGEFTYLVKPTPSSASTTRTASTSASPMRIRRRSRASPSTTPRFSPTANRATCSIGS